MIGSPARLLWERDGADWPNREASFFVRAGSIHWHVQRLGSGPPILLLHGTGASTHSWRDLAPMLASQFTVIAPDLPGHGFTATPAFFRFSMSEMASAIGRLLRALDLSPMIAAGHSAGAAILARMSLDGEIAAQTLVSLNGAFLPFEGIPGRILAPLAKLVAMNPLLPRLFAWRAGDPATVDRLLRDTGSAIDPEGLKFYRRLAANPVHVAGAIAMMANWDLAGLARTLPGLQPDLTLVVGGKDRTIPPETAMQVCALLPSARRIVLPGLGHLAHEERPLEVANIILDQAAGAGLSAPVRRQAGGGVQ
jgi:magnesium chelatase accessory protein